MKKVPKGAKFKLKAEDTVYYINERYSKNHKRFICHNENDISEIEHVKKNTKVYYAEQL